MDLSQYIINIHGHICFNDIIYVVKLVNGLYFCPHGVFFSDGCVTLSVSYPMVLMAVVAVVARTHRTGKN
jgi:hypothetical protein